MEMTIIGNVVNAILLAIAIWAIKIMISSVRKDIDDVKTDMRKDIKEVKDHMDECVVRLDKEDQEIWSAFNRHGHKGLNGNGARVTR